MHILNNFIEFRTILLQIRFLEADSGVVASYAASCLEKVIFIIGPVPDLLQIAPNLIQALMQLLKKPNHYENDYAMKGTALSLNYIHI